MNENDKPLEAHRVAEGVVLTFRTFQRTVLTYNPAEIDQLIKSATREPLRSSDRVPLKESGT